MFAVIDIGTNTVLLLIAGALPDGKFRAFHDLMTVTKLGEGLAVTGRISEAAIERTIAALDTYVGLCSKSGVSVIKAVGTQTLRMAGNSADFISLAKEKFNLDVEIISGEREARLIYEANRRDFGDEILVLDIGGGSTEFVTIPAKNRKERAQLEVASLPIGCVALTEKFLKDDPPSDDDIGKLQKNVRRTLENGLDPKIFARPHDRALVAASGTATTAAAMALRLDSYDPLRVHGMKIKIAEIRDIIGDVQRKGIEERKRIQGLPPSRADVILSGLCILHEAMVFLGHADFTVSDHGIRWGLLYEKHRT